METSKVQVEYSDPLNVYPSIETSIQSCFPLQNLHWSPSNRPLRSIDSLHIELIPDARTAISRAPGGKHASTEATRSSASSDTLSKAERRHQIPGLRQTPYLKIYFLSCDDVEGYKASSRPQLRDWVNKNSVLSQTTSAKTKQENHDAFEWLIVYLAQEGSDSTKTSAKAKSEVDGSKKASTSRWTTRSSKTVIEKVRSDFNGPSKHAVDHVAQFPMRSQHRTQGSPKGKSDDEDKDCNELVKRLKSLILASFDRRVQQYEEDIREKEMQRNLPGWNFNTFFVLKEGLARGFESVGLLEDALSSYHELTAGLENVLLEQGTETSYMQGTAQFVPITDDLQRILFQSLSELRQGQHDTGSMQRKISDLGSWILDTDRKPFRLLILENNISIFDFECYLFARKVSLLLRLANGSSSTKSPLVNSFNGLGQSANAEDKGVVESARLQNHMTLAEICKISMAFLRNSTWTLRRDLGYAADAIVEEGSFGHHEIKEADTSGTIDNLIASWTLSVCSNVLEVTLTPSVRSLVDSASRKLRRSTRVSTFNPTGAAKGTRNDEQTARFPRRTSSLSFRGAFTDIGDWQASPSSQSPAETDGATSFPIPAGTDELAGVRGDLISLAKRTLSSAGQRLRRWDTTCINLASDTGLDHQFTDVDLNGSELKSAPEDSSSPQVSSWTSLSGVINETLLAGLETAQGFVNLYERMTALALAHYIAGNRSKMTEAAYSDLAVLYFRLEDYDVAATYFKQLTSFYEDKEWLDLGASMLDSWAECLRKLGKTREAISVGLRALEASQDHLAKRSPRRRLGRLIEISKSLSEPMTVPFDNYFHVIKQHKRIKHLESWDGFLLDVSFRNTFGDAFDAKSLSVQLVEAGHHHGEEIWLSSEQGININKGTNTVTLSSKVVIPGWFISNKISLHVGNIEFRYEGCQKPESLALPDAKESQVPPSDKAYAGQQLLVWARSPTLSLSAIHSTKVDLSKPRSVEVVVRAGLNDILSANLIMRPVSAGLRLYTAKAEGDDISGDVSKQDKPSGGIALGRIEKNSKSIVMVPFDLEHDLSEIRLRLEIRYQTLKDSFVHVSREIIKLGLPITVNVQESFQEKCLFSRFTIGPAAQSPVRVFRAQITESVDFDARLHPVRNDKDYIPLHQPLSVIAQIRRRRKSDAKTLGASANSRLLLLVAYDSLSYRITHALERHLLEGLSAAGLENLSHVVLWHVKNRRIKRLEEGRMNFGLIRVIEPGRYQEFKWDELVDALDPPDGLRLREMLMAWHKTNRYMSLGDEEDEGLIHELVVPVDLPEVQFLHTVDLRVLPSSSTASSTSLPLTQDQAVLAELTVRHTRRWSHGEIEHERVTFYYEVEADPHTWLVGGQRTCHFSAEEGERLVFSLILVPLRSGHLPLPRVSIRPERLAGSAGDGEDARVSMKPSISSEVDYVSQGETVLVDPKVVSRTVSLEPDRWQEGVVQVDVQQGGDAV